MFPSVVLAGTVFTPGNGVGSVVSYWAMVVVATFRFCLCFDSGFDVYGGN